MLQLLLSLLGVHLEQAGRLAHWSIDTHGGIWMGWLIIAAAVLTTAVFWMYHRSAKHLDRKRRLLLSSLRALFLIMLLGILARPVLRLTVEGTIRRSVLMLVDVSQSMGIPDLRSNELDIKRAALAKNLIDPAKGLDQSLDQAQAEEVSHLSRMQVVQAALKNPKINLLPRLGRDYSIQPFTFGEKVNDGAKLDGSDHATADWVNGLKPTEPLTKIGDALSDVLGRTRGQPVAGLVLITDGQNNSGRSMILAADQAKLEGVPLYIYGVGISTPKDIIVSNVFTREIAFVDDELPVSVRVRNRGLSGESAKLVLSLNDKEVDSQDIVLDGSGEQVVAMKFTPATKGEYNLKARIEPRPDEASKDNNEASVPLKIVDDKIKVLYVEQSPRWEFKYLSALLMRDRRVEFKCLLLDGDPSLAEGDKTPFIKGFPESADDLTKFDLIILGDVDPHTFSDTQMENIQRFVQVGGGALMSIAGRQYNPWSYAGTKIADLLPVEISEDRDSHVGKPSDAMDNSDHPIQVELTPQGKESAALRLVDSQEANSDIWTKLPPIWWDARVYRAKPGAEVLLVDPDKAKESASGKMPIIATGQPGIGQVMYVGTDNLWRWRKNEGEKYYIALWGQMVQRLSLAHLLGGSKKTQISADQQKYDVGQKVTIIARLYDDALKPVSLPEVKGFYQADGGDPVPFQLRAEGDQKGIFRGEFIAPAPGAYKCWVERDDKTKRDFMVSASNVELSETAMNETGMRDMAGACGGKFFREEDLIKLPDELRNKTENVQSTYEVELWSTWIYLTLLVACVSIEWILRKIAMMK